LKELNEQSAKNRSSTETLDTNEDDMNENELYHKKLLYGLAKIRRLCNVRDTKLKISNIRRMRERYNIDIYRAFAHYGLSTVIPSNTWNITKSERRLSKIFSIQDEAFLLILLMNNWSVFESMARGEKRIRGKNLETLFTNTTKTYNGVSIKIKGWNNDGLKEFNETINYLTTVRNTDLVIGIEEDLMKEYKEMDTNRRAKRKRDNNDELILAERVLPQDGYSQTFEQR